MAVRDRITPFIHDLVGAPMEKKPFIRDGRRKLLAAAGGRVLEVGAGTGFNLPHYPRSVDDLTITDGSAGMLRRAEKRAEQAGRHVAATTADVENLPFEDGSLDP